MSAAASRRRLLVLGAAGRDFHDFLTLWRDDPAVEVVAFTAAQIPGIASRTFPASLAGPLYPNGIAIEPEDALAALCEKHGVHEVVFAYSDVPHAHVMHLASRALAAGCDFSLAGPRTMLTARRPVIAVSAVRTGCGKSQVARWIAARLRARGIAVAVLRHPMPYGDLASQRCQRFATRDDLARAQVTIEEREEYEPYVAQGCPVFAGVDYAQILRAAEAEAQVLLWDGGNNDFPFVRPGLHIVLADALRPGQVATHHPGEAVARMADLFVIAKSDAAGELRCAQVEAALAELAPHVPRLRGASPVTLDDAARVRGKRVIVVEDGPTLTHGGMAHGAGTVAAQLAGAREIVDPRPYAPPALARELARFPHLGPVLPALGYSAEQRAELLQTLDATPADLIVAGTPIDLAQVLRPRLPIVRARYEYAETSEPGLGAVVDAYVARALA
ncbi:MAG TPA: GTPase [Myxococcota bacterium]